MHPAWNSNFSWLIYTGRPLGNGRQILLSCIDMMLNEYGEIIDDMI
jgi:hypothetical protein